MLVSTKIPWSVVSEVPDSLSLEKFGGLVGWSFSSWRHLGSETLTTQVCVCVQLCLTLCNPMDYSLPDSSVHGIFQARILEWVSSSYSRGIFPTQGSNPHLLHWQVHCSTLSHMGSSYNPRSDTMKTCKTF